MERFDVLFEEERLALRAGRLEGLNALSARKNELIAKLETLTTPQSQADMARLKEMATRNAALLSAARISLADAIRKTEMRLKKTSSLTVYGADGQKQSI